MRGTRPSIRSCRPVASSFDPAIVRRGAELALIGDCKTCHTAPGGRVFAGGLAMPTPFGTIYSTNITPEPETGIGSWSEAAFKRAMREGVDRRGRKLYPAFPYDHFTLTTDDDIKALYAFFMTRDPVKVTAPANALPFPINVRLVLAGWKLLFLRERRLDPDPSRDEVWNRGRYLVEGLGHCGACHTPRNLMGAEEKSHEFQGGEAEGWRAYALGAASQSPMPWNEAALDQYLSKGSHGRFRVKGSGSSAYQKLRLLFRYPRSEPYFMTWLVPHQIKLTSGRHSKQLHQYPAFGGWGSGGRDHSFTRLFKPVLCSVPIAWIRQDRLGPGDCVGASALRWSSSRRPR